MAYGNGTNTPFGLKPSQYLNGTTWSGQMGTYNILPAYATSIFFGDPVIFANDGTIRAAGTAGSLATTGVFQGCKYLDTTGTLQFSRYWPASTATFANTYATAFVTDDPNLLYDIQASNFQNTPQSVATTSVQQAFGGTTQLYLNADYKVGGGSATIVNPTGGNTISGNSAYYLDVNSIGNTATLSLKIVRFTPVPGNLPGIIYNNVLVSLNNDVFKGGTGTLGV
jgi:hypothetical protein